MNLSTRALTVQIINSINATGANAPKAVTDTYQRTAQLSAAAHNLHVGPAALGDAVLAALDADRNPAADPEVQRVFIASQIANEGIAQHIDNALSQRFREVCQQHADAIVQGWAKPFDQAAATLTTAHQRIGSVPLEDTATIMRKGHDIAAVWAAAQNAAATIDTITGGWSALAEFTRLASVNRNLLVLRFADVDYPTWDRHHLTEKRLTPWEAVILGLQLSLPTLGEYRARAAAIELGESAPEQMLDTQRSAVAGRDIYVSA